MDFLQSILFESPVWLGVFCFVLSSAVLLARRRLTGKTRAYALPVVLLMTAVLFVLQWLVVTERERIQRTLDAFIAGIERENAPAWSPIIGEGYRGESMDRDEAIEFIRSALDSLDVYDTRLKRRDVRIDGDTAEMDLVALATVKMGTGPGQFHLASWKIGWAREQGEWRIVSIQPQKVDSVPFGSLRELGGHIP